MKVTRHGKGSRLELLADLWIAARPSNPIGIRFRLGDATCTRTVRFQAHRDVALRFPWHGTGDADGDGAVDDDCAKRDPGVHPGAVDVCGNGLDEDCNGADTPCAPPPRFPGALRVPDFGKPLAADVNDDGVMDLFSPVSWSLGVLLGRGDGTFRRERSSPYRNDGFGRPAVIADIDGDGILDLITGGNDGFVILRGRGGADFGDPESFAGDLAPFAVSDANGDGALDLVTGSLPLRGTSDIPAEPHSLRILLQPR